MIEVTLTISHTDIDTLAPEVKWPGLDTHEPPTQLDMHYIANRYSVVLIGPEVEC